uniref:Metaxin-1 n=1 Tax=Echeneis naucrates TaxID=173247 RepID=A0A665SZC4_ECHNA
MAAPDELFCWEGDWGLPSVSTDCLVVLVSTRHSEPDRFRPEQSGPEVLVCVFQKYNADFDLSAKEGADSLAFISLMEEKLAPALIYMFWVEPKNYVDVTRRWYAEHMPFPLNFFLPGRMQRQQLEKLRLLRGDDSLEAGEELEKELYRDAAECMNLLSQRLGSHKFFFGDSPSSLDAYVFGHLAPVLKSKLPNGKLQQHLKSLDNLANFCTNILLLYFPRDGRGDAVHPFRIKCKTLFSGGGAMRRTEQQLKKLPPPSLLPLTRSLDSGEIQLLMMPSLRNPGLGFSALIWKQFVDLSLKGGGAPPHLLLNTVSMATLQKPKQTELLFH